MTLARRILLLILTGCVSPQTATRTPPQSKPIEGSKTLEPLAVSEPPTTSLGSQIASLGDTNGDGVVDILTHVYVGAVDPIQVISGADGAILASTSCSELGIRVGSQVWLAAVIPDADGDGSADVVVCIRDGWTWQPPHCRALLVSGATGCVLGELAAAENEWVAAVFDPIGAGNGAVLRVLDGNGALRDLSLDGSWASPKPWLDEDAFYHRGTLDRVGDVDGHGRPDLVIGDRRGRGHFRIVSGESLRTLGVVDGIDGNHGLLGWTVAALGDLDSDGRSDLAIASSSGSTPFEWEERRYVSAYSGVSLQRLWTAVAEPVEEWSSGETRFGESLCAAPDLDGDGVPDVLVGIQDVFGRYVAKGGAVLALSGRTGERLRVFHGVPDESIGSAVLAIDDALGAGFVVGGCLEFGSGPSSPGFLARYDFDGTVLWSLSGDDLARDGETR